MEGGDSAPASDIFWAKRSIPPPFAPGAQRLSTARSDCRRKASRRASITGSHRACAGVGIYAPGFSSFTRTAAASLSVLGRIVRRRGHGARAGIAAPVLAFFGCVRGSSLLFSKERPAVDAWNSSMFGHPPSCQKHFRRSLKTHVGGFSLLNLFIKRRITLKAHGNRWFSRRDLGA
jgi:hypothetical protein